MFTRKQYTDGECTHQEYYGQFVGYLEKSTVTRYIGLERILNSKDPHLNDIPLEEWDRLPFYIGLSLALLKQTGEVMSRPTPATRVCILKSAARQLIEEHKNVHT